MRKLSRSSAPARLSPQRGCSPETAPPAAAAATEVQLNTPKNAIASRLAIQPETFSRILGKLRDQGLVAVHGHQITLRNLTGPRELVYLPAAEQPQQPRLC